MTREQAIKVLEMVEAHGSIVIEAKKMAVEALKAEPCEDAIGRHESIAALKKHFSDGNGIDTECGAYWHHGHVIDVLQGMPSVTTKQRTGHWIEHPKGIYAHLVCDKCLSNAPYDCKTIYCPNCGADMRESEE